MADYTHVADKLHGYTLQVRQMMYELISVDLDKVVSVESFDDVAVQENGIIIAQQVKSVTSKNNPLSNRSKVFWKTLYNWLNYVNTEALDVDKCVFRIVVSATYNLKVESIAKKFTDSNTVPAAEMALDSAKAILIGDSSIEKLPDSFRKYAESVFDNVNRSTMAKILSKTEIIIYNNNFDEVLFNRFCGQTIPFEYADMLFIYMLGWVHEEANKATKHGESPFILCGTFHDALVKQTRYYNQSSMIPSVTLPPDKGVIEVEVARQDVYIKQLNFIQVDFTLKFDAASDYLQTCAEKTEWGMRGTVNERSFDDYNTTLKRMWNAQKNIVSRTDDEITQGNKLYGTCQAYALTMQMDGKALPYFFGPGTLQILANGSGKSAIGWHPRFIDLLKDGDDENE